MTFLIQEVLLWRATVDEDGHYATPDVRQRSRFRKVVRLPSSATGLPLQLRTTFPTCRHPHSNFRGLLGLHFVTAHRIAHQPKAAFVAGLRPSQLPGRAACQLPDQSTIIRVRSSLTDSSRPWGARSISPIIVASGVPPGCMLKSRLKELQAKGLAGAFV